MKVPFQYRALAGVAAAMGIQPADAFLAPPPPPLALPSSPHRSLISSWLTGVDRENKTPESKNSMEIRTQTLHAPLESFEKTRQANHSPHEQHQQHQQRGMAAGQAGLAAGLLCLERPIPDEILRGLGRLVNDTAPFKAEVLRAGGVRGVDNHDDDEGWLDTLTAGIDTLGCCSDSANTDGEFELDRHQDLSPDAESQERRLLGNSGRRRKIAPTPTHQRQDAAASDQNLDLMQQQQRQQQRLETESQESVSWLKADIKRVASLFAREVSVLSTAKISSSGEDSTADGAAGKRQAKDEGEVGAADVTVKLELLQRVKCPRFHLDKVPIRLVCTYVGPSTEWLDGYDKRKMVNRSSTPAYNRIISGGRQARHARQGDVLIFRGESQGGDLAEGGALGVIHRSPDMVEGQGRLVLTIDAGDITAMPFAHPSS